jgi:TorA maturation chaperone TorD
LKVEDYLRVFYGLASSRGRLYGLLSQLYVRPPDSEFLTELFSREFEEIISGLLAQPTITGELGEGLELIRKFIGEWRGKALEEALEVVTLERNRLLRGQVLPSPCESTHRGESAGVAGFYGRVGVRIPEDAEEPPDHLGFELDFMRFLCGEEAAAWREGDLEKALNLVGMQNAFLKQHMKSWIPGFCDLMFEEAKLDLYRGLAKLTKGFLSQDERLLNEFLSGMAEALEEAKPENMEEV